MRARTVVLGVTLLWCALNAPTLAAGDESIAFTFDFGVNVTKERKQGFGFVTLNPSIYKDVELETLHEKSNELGKRQYCPKGWEIVSGTPVNSKYRYEGMCKRAIFSLFFASCDWSKGASQSCSGVQPH